MILRPTCGSRCGSTTHRRTGSSSSSATRSTMPRPSERRSGRAKASWARRSSSDGAATSPTRGRSRGSSRLPAAARATTPCCACRSRAIRRRRRWACSPSTSAATRSAPRRRASAWRSPRSARTLSASQSGDGRSASATGLRGEVFRALENDARAAVGDLGREYRAVRLELLDVALGGRLEFIDGRRIAHGASNRA